MGLDMYAYTTKRRLWKGVDFPVGDGDTRLFYWRKHPNLHGWMERLYEAKGGEVGDFNCATLQLGLADLDALQRAIEDKRLPFTTGFFFGSSQNNADERAEDLDFIAKARDAIGQGLCVYYTSSW